MPTANSITIFLKVLGEHRRIQILYDVHTLQTFVIAVKFVGSAHELGFSDFSVFLEL